MSDTKKIVYPVKTYRISEEVARRLEEEKKRAGLSWNMFFAKLLDQLEQD